MDAAQRAYDRLKGGVDADQLAVLEARLDAARAGVAAFTVSRPVRWRGGEHESQSGQLDQCR